MMRMSYESFKKILGFIKPHITPRDSAVIEAQLIRPAERLVLAILFLATSETYRSLSLQFRVSERAIYYWWSYKRDSTVYWQRLHQDTINCGRLVKNIWNISIEMEIYQLLTSNQRKAYSDKTLSWYRLWIFQLQKNLFNNFIGYSRT